MILRREFLGGYEDLDIAVKSGYDDFLEMVGFGFGDHEPDEVMTLISDIIEASENDFYYINTDDDPAFIERYFVAQTEDPLEIWGMTTTTDTTGVLM